MKPFIAVVDYGMGNLRSVVKALEEVSGGQAVRVVDDPAGIAAAERIVVPGQGAMPDCRREIEARRLTPALLKAAADKPFLGICIGLQLLFDQSAEGNAPGLGILRGSVQRFPAGQIAPGGERLKVPHMGWNRVRQKMAHPLWNGIPDAERFYFVHSYYVAPADPTCIAGESEHGIAFTSACARDNIFAVQFHPEKSAAAGGRFLANFLAWQP